MALYKSRPIRVRHVDALPLDDTTMTFVEVGDETHKRHTMKRDEFDAAFEPTTRKPKGK